MRVLDEYRLALLGGLALPMLATLAWTSPAGLGVALGLACAAAVSLVVLRHTTACCIAWLLAAALSAEMALLDLFGPPAFGGTIAAVKGGGVVLAAVCAARWGVRLDPLNPAWGFLLIGLWGAVAGLAPDLAAADSLRSLAGSVAPFAFCFCRPGRSWAGAMLAATRWAAVVAVLAGSALDLLGLRPLFVDSGGLRLAGAGHPAFLADVALTATAACLLEVFRAARLHHIALLVANLAILVLTGARAPLACALGLGGLALLAVPSAVLPPPRRLLALLVAACASVLAWAMAGELVQMRVFNLLSADAAAHLSGRDLLWPVFAAAAEGAPWLGWGLGAGNVVIAPHSQTARLLHTWAAHNEYLRLQVEAGWLGLGLLLTLFVAWATSRTAALPPTDKWLLRLVFGVLALHAVTDNVLISSPACVFFAFLAAAFARGEWDMRLALPDSRAVA